MKTGWIRKLFCGNPARPEGKVSDVEFSRPINWCLQGCRNAKPPLPKGRCPEGAEGLGGTR